MKKSKKQTTGKKNIKKGSSRRSRTKFPALDPKFNLKTRTELIDYDYVNKLSDKDKAWLNKFTEEYTNASFDTKRPRRNIHTKNVQRKECYNRNNARNRDIFTKAKAMNKLSDYEVVDYSDDLERTDENAIIESIDLKRK